MHGTGGGNGYLRMYPKLKKWMNQCIGCQTKGFKPEMPKKLPPGGPSLLLQHYFNELALNDGGLCRECQTALDDQQGSR